MLLRKHEKMPPVKPTAQNTIRRSRTSNNKELLISTLKQETSDKRFLNQTNSSHITQKHFSLFPFFLFSFFEKQ